MTLTKEELEALQESTSYYIKRWPNEECIPDLKSALRKIELQIKDPSRKRL